MTKKPIGIIGGSGLYQMDGVAVREERVIETPFGAPSDSLFLAQLDGVEVVFLPRHGRGHMLNPSEINHRANIWALKSLGVEQMVSVSAVGSMREDVPPGHFVLIDQLIDRTRNRPYTFFENGITAHVSMAQPFSQRMIDVVYSCRDAVATTVHKGGTYVCIEGPAFSTKAESLLYRSWGVDVIGMTNYQEARLAREAEICACTIALSTDYDCWHEEEAAVDGASVLEVVKKNVTNVQQLLRAVITKLDASPIAGDPAATALEGAIYTSPDLITATVKERLAPIIARVT